MNEVKSENKQAETLEAQESKVVPTQSASRREPSVSETTDTSESELDLTAIEASLSTNGIRILESTLRRLSFSESAAISGIIRGIIGEEVSIRLPMESCEDISVNGDFSQIKLDKLKLLSPDYNKEKGLKQKLLEQAFSESLRARRMPDLLSAIKRQAWQEVLEEYYNNPATSDSKRKELTQQIKARLGKGEDIWDEPLGLIEKYLYDAKTTSEDIRRIAQNVDAKIPDLVERKIDEGIDANFADIINWYQDEGTIPDGALLGPDGKLIGLCEVKSYTPEEFQALIDELQRKKADGKLTDPWVKVKVGDVEMELGAKVETEINFIDRIRQDAFSKSALRDDMPMLLRFPADIPEENMALYAQFLEELGFSRVLIQKLPLSSTELLDQARAIVQANLETIKKGNVNTKLKDKVLKFSDSQLKALEELSK